MPNYSIKSYRLKLYFPLLN